MSLHFTLGTTDRTAANAEWPQPSLSQKAFLFVGQYVEIRARILGAAMRRFWRSGHFLGCILVLGVTHVLGRYVSSTHNAGKASQVAAVPAKAAGTPDTAKAIIREKVSEAKSHLLARTKLPKFFSLPSKQQIMDTVLGSSGRLFIRYVGYLWVGATIVHDYWSTHRLHKKRVRSGREPLLQIGVTERVVRLVGSKSETTNLTGEMGHVVPVGGFFHTELREELEEPTEADMQPVRWHIERGCYRERLSWSRFFVTPQWLLAGRYFVIEADASSPFTLFTRGSNESLTTCLSVQEVSQAVGQLRSIVDRDIVRKLKDPAVTVISVMLCDTTAEVRTGGGSCSTTKDLAALIGGIDLVVDSKATVIRQIIQWIGMNTTVALCTSSPEMFHSAKHFLSCKSIAVEDLSMADLTAGRLPDKTLPIIVYNRSTGDTVHVTKALRRILPHAQPICFIVEAIDKGGPDPTIQDLSKSCLCVCGEVVHGLYLARVRSWIREGRSITEIQSIVDQELGDLC